MNKSAQLLSSSSSSPLSLLPPLRSPVLRVSIGVFLAAEGPTHPLWLIIIPSDPLVYPSSSFPGGWHGSVMIFPLLRPLLSNPLISCLLWAAGLGERSACSITYGKQTNNYCPDDHLHNTDNTFNMLPLLYFKYLVHGGLSWRALLNANLEIYFI